MKTAISLPDKLFADADALAKKLSVSRSELYATALSEYVGRHNAAAITARLDAIHSVTDLRLEPVVAGAQARPMSREDHW